MAIEKNAIGASESLSQMFLDSRIGQGLIGVAGRVADGVDSLKDKAKSKTLASITVSANFVQERLGDERNARLHEFMRENPFGQLFVGISSDIIQTLEHPEDRTRIPRTQEEIREDRKALLKTAAIGLIGSGVFLTIVSIAANNHNAKYWGG